MILRRFRYSVHLLIATWLISFNTITSAYEPPVDEAAPLLVRIVGPSEVTQLEQAIPIVVDLQNRGDSLLAGELKLGLIDDWSSEPKESIEFSIPAHANLKKTFQVLAGPKSYQAHYPIHAVATFEWNGEKMIAHPILIVEAKQPSPQPAAPSLPWQPVRLSPNSMLALWQVAVHRTVVEVFGENPIVRQVGQDGSEPRSRADVSMTTQTLANQARSVVAMHPPWNEGHVGTVAVEYPLELPSDQSIKLHFANAMSLDGQSDGVTFRVRVAGWDAAGPALGKVVFERHTDAKTWQDAEVDLSPFAGQTIRLQLESHPGPNNNTGWDRCFWAEPTLAIGTPPSPREFPPLTNEGSQLLGTSRNNDSDYSLRLWPGVRGLLDAVVGITDGKETVYLRGFQVTVLNARLDQPGCPLRLTQVQSEPVANGVQIRHLFDSTAGPFELVGWVGVEQEVLQVRFAIENAPPAKPWLTVRIEDLAIGNWSHAVQRVYAGTGNVLVKPEAFQLSFDGHRLSTSFVGYDFDNGLSLVEATDVPPIHLDVRPEQRHASLHASDPQTRTLIPASSVWQGVKQWRAVNGQSAADGVPQAAGRFVFDLWGGRYAESGEALQKAFRYGLTDSMVIWHNWQRWGYDYRLPEIFPPNPRYGTTDELKAMSDSCGQAGVLFALHDNYIDYYPDAEGFSYEKTIAFRQDGTPVQAWLNEGRGAQSYRYRSDCVAPILKNNLRMIGQTLAPSAYFIDVWSSVRPYDYWTANGEYYSCLYSRDTWGALFSWIRDHLGNHAPQISESGHDQLIGWLDGAQTNHLRVGDPKPGRYRWSVWDWNCEDAERIPWFDAAHHDRFILHGAGYESRYAAGLDTSLHGMYSDDYIVTELLTGHPAMVSRPFDRDVVRKYWLTHDVLRALAMRTLEDVVFIDDDIHRQQVSWSGNGQVLVNRAASDWETAGVTLPQHGVLARVPTEAGVVLAAIERRDGVIVERSESPAACYFNARSIEGNAWPIKLTMEKLRYTGNRRFEMQLRWDTGVAIPSGWVPFLHFCDSEGAIVFQAVHQPQGIAQPEAGVVRATAVGAIPEQCESGQSYEFCFGLYNPASGRRLNLVGPGDGDQRVRLGSLRLDGDKRQLRDVAWTPYDSTQDPVLQRQNPNGQTIDFGMLATNNGCRLTHEDGRLIVTPLPTARRTDFDVAIRWKRLPWQLPLPHAVEAIDEQGKVLSRTAVRSQNDTVTITCQGDVFAYRLVP